MKRNWSVLALSLFLASCWKPHVPPDSDLETNLGQAGNERVLRSFNNYKLARAMNVVGCKARGNHPRAIVSGFGLFSGNSFNISGVVVESLANKAIFPDEMETSVQSLRAAPLGAVEDGKLPFYGSEAQTWNRTLVIDGKPFDVCFIHVDVMWDLAAAIVIHEMFEFRPAVVLMSGFAAGQIVRVEKGSHNNAGRSPAYNRDGSAARAVAPRERYLLPPNAPGVQNMINMTWDNKSIATHISPLVKEIWNKFEVKPTEKINENDDYICNNTSYVVLHAAKGVEVELAGGKVRLKASGPLPAKIGFLHLPTSNNDSKSVQGWGRVFAKIIVSLGASQ